MSIREIIELIKTDGLSWVIVIYIVCQLVEVSKIELNPITWLWEWVGKKMNGTIINRIEKIEVKLDKHIDSETKKTVKEARKTIFEFAATLNKEDERPSQRWHKEVMEICDFYEKYCKDNNIPNGVADAEIEMIRNKYKEYWIDRSEV